MNRKKLFRQTMTVLGGLAVGLAFLPTATKAETSFRDTNDSLISPAPSNNPTRANTVNGTTLPVWSLNESEKITYPSTYLSVYSSDRDNLSIRDLLNRPIDTNASTAPISSSSARTGAMSEDNSGTSLPGQVDKQMGKPTNGQTNPTGSMNDRTIPPSRSNTPGESNINNGTTIPDQTINGNQEIDLPSDRTNGDRTNGDRMNGDRVNTGSGTVVPNSADNLNMNNELYIPSGQGRQSGHTGGPPLDPLPTGGNKEGQKPSMNNRTTSGTTGDRSTTTTPTGTVDRTTTPSRMTPGSGTTVPDQTINENQEINTPSGGMNSNPGTTRRSNTHRTNSTTPTNSNTRTNINRDNTGSGTRAPSDTGSQNMNITPDVPSGRGQSSTGNTGGPPQSR